MISITFPPLPVALVTFPPLAIKSEQLPTFPESSGGAESGDPVTWSDGTPVTWSDGTPVTWQ